MAHYTIKELTEFRLGACLDTYIVNIEFAIPCTECNTPVLSMPLNDYATKHIMC